jgi:DNA-directed RNA polymerase II subunit RPB11
MTNAPDRFLTWRWEEEPDSSLLDDFSAAHIQAGVPPPPRRVTYTKDSKRPNAGTFVFAKEDHTLGNLLRVRLLTDPNVRYAGYRMPHPLIFDCHVRIETVDAKVTPAKALETAVQSLQQEIDFLSRDFNEALKQYEQSRDTFA